MDKMESLGAKPASGGCSLLQKFGYCARWIYRDPLLMFVIFIETGSILTIARGGVGWFNGTVAVIFGVLIIFESSRAITTIFRGNQIDAAITKIGPSPMGVAEVRFSYVVEGIRYNGTGYARPRDEYVTLLVDPKSPGRHVQI